MSQITQLCVDNLSGNHPVIISLVCQGNTLTCRTVTYKESQHRGPQHFQRCPAKFQEQKGKAATRIHCQRTDVPISQPNLLKDLQMGINKSIWILNHICCLKHPRSHGKVIPLCPLLEFGCFL